MVDEICRGRWYGKENGSETAIKADLDKLMGSLRYSKDSDMFSIIANRYATDPSKLKKVVKKDFIALNRSLAKDGGTYKNMSRSTSSLGFHAGYNGGLQTKERPLGRSVSSMQGTYGRGRDKGEEEEGEGGDEFARQHRAMKEQQQKQMQMVQQMKVRFRV